MLKLTATTRNETIQRATRDELRETLLAVRNPTDGNPVFCVSEINKMNKTERVTCCRTIRDNLEKQAIAREAELETMRLEKLETERKNPVYSAAIAALHTGLTKYYDEEIKTIAAWQETVTKSDPTFVVWNMENGIEGVFFASAVADNVRSAVHYLKQQHEQHTDTVQDIKQHLQDHADELLRRCLNDEGYNHNSTSEVDSVKSREQFRALQTAARLMKNAVKAFTKDTDADNVGATIYGGSLHATRGF
jgi:hypothetical protein